MKIRFNSFGEVGISEVEVSNSKCVDTVRLPDDENGFIIFGLVIWEHPKNYRRMVLYKSDSIPHTLVARCETISAFSDKGLKPLARRLKKAVRENRDIDITEEKTDLTLKDIQEIISISA